MPLNTFNQAMDIARQHQQSGRLAEAERIYRWILAQEPNHSGALHLLGVLAHQVGRNEEAEELILQAIELDPTSAEIYYHLGFVLQSIGDLDDAALAYRRAVEIDPLMAEGWVNLGNVLCELGKLEEADEAYRQAIVARPDYATAYSNLGIVLKRQGRFEESLTFYSRAIAIKPDLADAYSNMATSLVELRRLDEAIAAAMKAIQLAPGLVEAYNNLATALRERGRLDDAAAACEQALKLRPNLAEACLILGNVRADQARLQEAMDCYDRAVALRPNDAKFESNRLYAMHFHPAYDSSLIYREHRKYNEKFAAPLGKLAAVHQPRLEANRKERARFSGNADVPVGSYANADEDVGVPGKTRTPDRKLRIGYVSADLRTHPVGRFILPVLEHHNREEFEIICYSDTRTPDALTAKLQGFCTCWHDVAGWSDERVSKLIRDDEIDILIDLTMHMANGRPLLFARKPAPVQVTYLAYCSTMGMDAIDYRLTDPYLDPPGFEQGCYSEQSIWLPRTYWCYEPGMPTSAVAPLPALETGFVTFGCLNNFSKVSKDALETWGRLLLTVVNSRLILHAPPGSARTNVAQFMASTGVDPNRIAFVGKLPGPEYFAQYRRIDIALDPFPYSGGTTTCDAMWMGVPVVTLAGQTAVGRSGVSLLSNVGLSKWIVRSKGEYTALAAEMTRDLPALAKLRAVLRDRMRQSPLMDAPRFAADVEAAYRSMWEP